MRLGIDARLYFQTGVGVYVRNLLFYLPKYLPSNWEVFVYVLKRDAKKIKLPKRYVVRPVDALWHSVKEQAIFLKALLSDKLDLVHFTYFSYPLFFPKKFVITLHDVTPLHFKTGKASTKNRLVYEVKHQVYKLLIFNALKRADKIITPSKYVAEELVSLGAKKEKISAIYEGINKELVKLNSLSLNDKKKTLFKKPFFLYVGNFYPHKNVETAIEAFLSLSKSSDKMFFYLLGPEDYFSRRLKLKYKDFLEKQLIFLHNFDTSTLILAYKNALALVHPSFSEGFGLTLLEALFFKCPVIASNLPVFKELYGKAVMYFNPKDKADLRKTLAKFLRLGKEEKKKIITLGKKVAESFSFDKTAKMTANLYKDIL